MPAATAREQVAKALDALSEAELQQVAEYVAFLKFRARIASLPRVADAAELAALYSEAADEDRSLAEEGLEEYQDHLLAEDTEQ